MRPRLRPSPRSSSWCLDNVWRRVREGVRRPIVAMFSTVTARGAAGRPSTRGACCTTSTRNAPASLSSAGVPPRPLAWSRKNVGSSRHEPCDRLSTTLPTNASRPRSVARERASGARCSRPGCRPRRAATIAVDSGSQRFAFRGTRARSVKCVARPGAALRVIQQLVNLGRGGLWPRSLRNTF